MSSQAPGEPREPGQPGTPSDPGESNPWAAPRWNGQQQPSEPRLDPNDPYRFGRPDPDPNDPYRFGPPGYQPPHNQQPGYQHDPYRFGPPQQPYPSPPPYSRYPQPPARSGLAITGLVLGIIGLLLAWIPVVGTILGILGIVFAAVGLRATRAPGTGGRGLAIGGLVCGAIATIACTVWSVYLFNRVADCAPYSGSPSYQLCIQNG